MNYIYDVLANFHEELYDFFDWNTSDNISHIRKIPLFKINTKSLNDIKNNQVIFDEEFLEKIYQRTEVFTNRSVKGISYACLLTDGSYVMAIQVTKSNSLEKSHLLIEEELEVIDSSSRLKEYNINYTIRKPKAISPFRTRKQLEMERFLKKELANLKKEKDSRKISYLYYECFNEKIEDSNKILELIDNSLEKNFDLISNKLYSFFKLLQVKK